MEYLEKKVPDISLPDQNGCFHKISDYEGKKVLLYFYPKDDTPGCTIEACEMQKNLKDIMKRNTVVLGVSADSVTSHKSFSQKYKLQFPLLSDEEKKLITHFELWREKNRYGKKYFGIARESFLLDEHGKVIKHYKNVKPEEHSAEVLEDIAKCP